MDSADGYFLYRIVRSSPPSERDFWSHERLGKPLLNPANRLVFAGVSMFGTLAAARAKARRYPDIGGWIAEIRIPASASVRVAQTGNRREKHFTIWADPALLLKWVTQVVPVDSQETT